MKLASTLFVSLLFTFVSISLVSSQAQAQNAFTLEDELDQKLADLNEQYSLRGLAASVVFSDGSTWSSAEGTNGDDGPMTSDILFEMGSSTKTFTAAIILQMVEEGKISLNDSLGQYFDSLENIDMGVTLRECINHTSGIYSYTDHDDFWDLMLNDPYKEYTPQEMLDQCVDPMRFEPGAKWRYSNTNFLLLGLIIEQVDERPYHESLRKRLFEPFGLNHSYLDTYESYTEPRSGYWLDEDDPYYEPLISFMSAAWAAGGVLSTTEDLAIWADKLYSGEVLSQAWTDSLTTPSILNGNELDFGMSTFLSKYKGYDVVGHGGTTLQHSTMDYIPELDITLVTVTNEETRAGALGRIKNELMDLIIKKPWGLSTDGIANQVTSLYPNPATSSFSINTQLVEGQLVLFDLTGMQVLEIAIETQSAISVDHLEKGTYIAEIRGPKGKAIHRDRLVIM